MSMSKILILTFVTAFLMTGYKRIGKYAAALLAYDLTVGTVKIMSVLAPLRDGLPQVARMDIAIIFIVALTANILAAATGIVVVKALIKEQYYRNKERQINEVLKEHARERIKMFFDIIDKIEA